MSKISGHEAMNTSRLHGSVIRVSRWWGVYDHYGIYVWNPSSDQASVVHYTDEEGHDFSGVVRETPLGDFLQGASEFSVCRFKPTNHSCIYSGEETVSRARSKLGCGDYNLLFNNCEHFAVWCKTGKRNSSQCARGIKMVVSFVVFLVGAAVLGRAGGGHGRA
ncbi:MAG: lecithin retinol acyltransferase family protein [Fretibacterium sp.]|nr:lecithin retinol acyltransferase family protein [Fretibacterium sp.]